MKKFTDLDANALIHGVPFISVERANKLLEDRLGETNVKPPRKGKKNEAKKKNSKRR